MEIRNEIEVPKASNGPNIATGDVMDSDRCPPSLAVAEQILIEDAQQMVMDAFHERDTELEAEVLEAKTSFMTALATRGGN